MDKRRRLLLRWTLLTGGIAVVALAAAWFTQRAPDATVVPGAAVHGLTSVLSTQADLAATRIRFQDITAQTGITFRHFPTVRASQLPEDMGSGVAIGDYDADGLPDLFFVNFSGSVVPDATIDRSAGRARLYRNLGGWKFQDVTEQAGLGYVGFGMGASWADYDGDGALDLYITVYGANVLYRNRGDGTFEDTTALAGVGDDRFSSGAGWADYDRDGDLDLFVCNYVNFVYRKSANKFATRQYDSEQPFTLNPSAYRAQANSLFRNNGDGTFDDVAKASGVANPEGRSLSVSWVDFDNDGWPDLYVANDVSNNGVFHNRGDGTFADIGPQSLAADYRGAMGIAVADFDDDLDQDLLVTHWVAQENALFRNMQNDRTLGPSSAPQPWFMDDADLHGLGQVSLDMVGWATSFCDFDNDGRRDLWLINGSTLEQSKNHRLLKPQRGLVFWQGADGQFTDVTAQASARLATPFVGRGGAQADLDRDGLVDLVAVIHGGSPILLRNVSSPTGHWSRVVLSQRSGNTRAIGAVAYLTTGDQTQMAVVAASSSYLSQSETTLHFGLGEAERIDSLRIVWPDGAEETHTNLEVDTVLSFVRAAAHLPSAATADTNPSGFDGHASHEKG